MGTGSPRLVLVGTPIGNLGDLSERVAQAFAAADVVACEDTRRTGKLLAHLGVRAPRLLRLDEHTEFELGPEILARISSGEVVAVASDAGMPGLSDPGARVAALVAEAGLQIEVIPGPFAAAVPVKEFLMVGNSVRSDVLPVLELGARAVHVPYHVTWALEEHDSTDLHAEQFHSCRHISELPELLSRLN